MEFLQGLAMEVALALQAKRTARLRRWGEVGIMQEGQGHLRQRKKKYHMAP